MGEMSDLINYFKKSEDLDIANLFFVMLILFIIQI